MSTSVDSRASRARREGGTTIGAFLPARRRARVALLAVVAMCALVGAAQWYLSGRVAYGVAAGGVPLGGMTEPRAREALGTLASDRGLATVKLETHEGQVAVTLDQLGINVDVAGTAARALESGRLHAPLGVLLWYGRGGEVAPIIRVDTARFQAALDQYREAVEVRPRDARLVLRGTSVDVRPAADGTAVDEVALQREIEGALMSWQSYSGPVPTRPAAAAVSTAAAEQAAQAAQVYVSRPLDLRYRGRVVRLSSDQLAAMLSVNTGADAAAYPLTFDNPRARRALHRLFAFAETPARNARVELRGKKVFITRSQDGFGLDMPRLTADMDDAASRQGLRSVIVALAKVPADPSTEDLQRLGLAGLGSQFSTYFDPGNTSRANNIAQAARLVDGAVVDPGATFSLNATLGPRTLNRGFDYAPIISGGVLRQGVGGGVCQFATTLFNAVFFAGLPVVERQSHTLYIDHYPIGRDATVAWGANDLKFRNDTGSPLMIRCYARKGELTVVLVGDIRRTVTYKTGAFYDIHPPATSKAHPRVIYDDDLSQGIVVWEKGSPGRSVRVTRTVSEDGRRLFSDTFASTYQAKDWVKRIGTR